MRKAKKNTRLVFDSNGCHVEKRWFLDFWTHSKEITTTMREHRYSGIDTCNNGNINHVVVDEFYYLLNIGIIK